MTDWVAQLRRNILRRLCLDSRHRAVRLPRCGHALPVIVAVSFAAASTAFAQTPSGNLTDLMDSGLYTANGGYNQLEIAAARTDDAAYAALLTICTPAPAAAVPPSTCTGNTLKLFNRLRELEDTANGLLGRGEQTYSLRLNFQNLGFALRWTAPEEYAAQGSMTTKFANSQLTTLSGRFSTLRFITQIARLEGGSDYDPDADSGEPRLSSYSSGMPLGGSAGADGTSIAPNWGGFTNGSYSAGRKDPTTFEDAFNFNDTEYSAGSDLRLNNHIVVGVLAGYTIKHINFNSSESIVDGGMTGEGASALLYAQWEGESAFVNAAMGLQHLSLETRRSITYPSLNPLVPSVNETSTSSTGANSWIVQLGTGYSFHWRGFSLEPYLNGQYVNTRIDNFTEHDGNGFDIAVGQQTIPSFITAAGLKFQNAFLPKFGVILPYIYGEYRHEFLENSRNINSNYADSDVTSTANFDLPTDAPTRNYYVVGAGLTMVFKHGVSAFVQYVRVLQMTNYVDYVASGGIRFEF
jgi:uncharacterized protein YhjY with autotransporter beta-barrel domain